jgi:predicted transcriptional regulator
MDRIFSARLDDGVVHRISSLSHRLRIPKKQVLERAVMLLSDQEGNEKASDFLDESFGAWVRKESPDALVAHARNAFRKSVERRKKL